MLITGIIATVITTAQWLTVAKVATIAGTACLTMYPAVEAMKEKNER